MRADDGYVPCTTPRLLDKWPKSRMHVCPATPLVKKRKEGRPNDRHEQNPLQARRVTPRPGMLESAGESWCQGTCREPRTLILVVHLAIQASPQKADEHPGTSHEGQHWAGCGHAERRRSGLLSLRGAGVALVVLAVGLFVCGSVAGCRTTREGAPGQPACEAQPNLPPASAADSYLATETGHMAVEDQKRAREAYRLRRRTVPHRDYPIRPVLPP